MKRFVCILGVVCCAAQLFAQAPKQIRIEFPDEGKRHVWIGDGKNPGGIKTPEPASGKSIVLDSPSEGNGFIVYAHDERSGNVAEKPLSDVLRAGTWKVQLQDEKRIYEMTFDVVHDGKPVASAVVKAKAGTETREALLTPADKGRVSIYNVLPGTVDVTVQYKSGGTTQSSPTQAFEAKLGAGAPQVRTLDVSGQVETVGETKPQDSTKTDEKPEAKEPAKRPEVVVPPNPAVSALNLLIGLAVVGGLGWFIWNYVKKNPKQVEDMLKKAGLGDQPQQATDPAQVTSAPPEPLKQIVLDPAPTVQSASPTAMTVANPRLVRNDGSVVLIMEGENVVGREDGLQVSIPGESSVSRHHAQFVRIGDEVKVKDLGSTNGTFINGAKITDEVVLRSGDTLQFGAASFRFEV